MLKGLEKLLTLKQEKYFTSIQVRKNLVFELQPKLVKTYPLYIYFIYTFFFFFFAEKLTILECIQLQLATAFFTIRNHHETFERVRESAMRGIRAYIDSGWRFLSIILLLWRRAVV